jgi:antitoxin component of RelBE/YafQ-DinJ toxin-antitoxin module
MAETFNRASVALTTTSITDVYQAPSSNAANRAIVLGCLVANVDGAVPADVTVTITDASNVVIARIANTIAVPADASIELIINKLVLKAGEKLRATASAANDLEVTVSALEITV